MMEEMNLKDVNWVELQGKWLEWFTVNILTFDFFAQFILISGAFIIAFFLTCTVKTRLNDLINKLTIPYKLTEFLYNIVRGMMPLLAMVFIFIGTKIIGATGLGFSVSFASAISKLLLAWIFIRLVSQVIEQRFARNIISFTVLGLLTLSVFGVLDQTMATLDSIGFSIGEFRLSALSVAKGVLGIFVLMYAALFLANLTDRKIQTVKSLNPSSRVLISKIARVFLVVTALLIGITSAGIDLSLFAVFSGAVGLGVGFGWC